MGMIMNYRRVTSAEIQSLLDNPDSVEDFVFGESAIVGQGVHIDVDKAWHAIHFLLNGDAWTGKPPFHNVVLGGTDLDNTDVGDGPARYLSVDEVREAAEALARVSRDDLVGRYSAQALTDAEIYPSWNDPIADREYIGSYYEMLVKFFQSVAARGEGMLVFIA